MRHLVLGMTDEDVVRRFHAVVGCGSVYEVDKKNPKWKQFYRWQSSRWPDIERVLTEFLPYLGERRRAAAEDMLGHPALPPGSKPQTHCKRGHELTGDNLYLYRGVRHCRACRKMAYEKKNVGQTERHRAARLAARDTHPASGPH
jgi:hypothetical protein